MTAEPLWTVHEAAAYLKMSSSWLYKRVAEGAVPHVKLGNIVRFVPDQVRQFAVAAATVAPPGARVIPLNAARPRGGR